MITVSGSPQRIASAGHFREESLPASWYSDTVELEGGSAMDVAEWAGPADITGVTDPAPESIYRQGWMATTGSMGYTINGLGLDSDYTVRVHFAVPTGTSSGEYVFDVQVVASTTQSSLDIDPVAREGAGKADYVEFDVTTDDGQDIVITITPNSGKMAVVCGIEVIAAAPTEIPVSELPTDENPTVLGTGRTTAAPTIRLQLSDGSYVSVVRTANSLIAADDSGVNLETVTVASLGLKLGIFE